MEGLDKGKCLDDLDESLSEVLKSIQHHGAEGGKVNLSLNLTKRHDKNLGLDVLDIKANVTQSIKKERSSQVSGIIDSHTKNIELKSKEVIKA